MHKHNSSDAKNRPEPKVELEEQFIMRLPPDPARTLRETLRNGLPLKDRLSIKMEHDLRYGEVRFDNWQLHAKLVDLPTVVESLKTIDNKSFYKTADICQILICKEEDDQTTTDEESPVKQKKKDPTKVDKKYLWPHGVTPPTKNVRRRRFRKTLKKKYVEAPEIEKEVKRLLRSDNEAVSVTHMIINEDEDASKPNVVSPGEAKPKVENINDASQSVDVAEHDIFGEAVSDSEDDDEENHINVTELDENSRLSVDSRVSDSNSMQVGYSEQSANIPSANNSQLVTEFSKEMFETEEIPEVMKCEIEEEKIPKLEAYDEYEVSLENVSESHNITISKDTIQARREQLQAEIAELQESRRQQENSIISLDNASLRDRLQDVIDNLIAQEAQKIQELNELDLVEGT